MNRFLRANLTPARSRFGRPAFITSAVLMALVAMAPASHAATAERETKAAAGQSAEYRAAVSTKVMYQDGRGRNCGSNPANADLSACSGVRKGAKLAKVPGDLVIDAAYVKAHGAVVEKFDVAGDLIIKAPNVVVRDIYVHCGAVSHKKLGACINVGQKLSGIVGYDITVRDEKPDKFTDAIWPSYGSRWARIDLSNTVDGIKLQPGISLDLAYVHDLTQFPSDPNIPGDASHNDCAQAMGSGRAGATYRINRSAFTCTAHNTKGNPVLVNTAIQLAADKGSITGLTVTNSYLGGSVTGSPSTKIAKFIINVANKPKNGYAPIEASFTNVVFAHTPRYGAAIVYGNRSKIAFKDCRYDDGTKLKIAYQ